MPLRIHISRQLVLLLYVFQFSLVTANRPEAAPSGSCLSTPDSDDCKVNNNNIIIGKMKAIIIANGGGPASALQVAQVEKPKYSVQQVLIKVSAAGVNRPDILQRSGKYPPPKGASPYPGLEVAGEVAEVGDDVTSWKVGDKVCALTHGGGYAEFVAVHQSHCLPVPEGFSMVEAAAIPETFFTVFYNVFMLGKLSEGESLLVHGGSSGIGTTAIQLAKSFGAKVITTVGNEEKRTACEKLGADKVINYKTEDWAAIAEEFVKPDGGLDVVFDMVAGDYIQRNLNLLKQDGRYMFVAFLGGAEAKVNFGAVLRKRLTIKGSTLRPRTDQEKGDIAAQLKEHVWPRLGKDAVHPVIYKTFAFADVIKAHELMETSTHIGKIVLTLD